MLQHKRGSIKLKSTFYSNEKASGRRASSFQAKRTRSDLSDYEFLETLGVGGFGTVRKAIHRPTGQAVAVKICSPAPGETLSQSAEQEAQLQRSVLHANIAQIYEVIYHEGKAYIIMEYCRNGELFDRINREGRLGQQEAGRIFHQILSALAYLRACGLSHRDIKPENILFDEQWNAKLIDFGFCCEGQAKFRSTVCGTPSYSPPEILRRQPYDPELVDVWSLGVTLYTMLAAELPFEGESFQQRRKNIMAFRYKQQPYFSSKVTKLFASIFVDAKYRPKLADLMLNQFVLSQNFAQSDYINFKHENPEVQSKVTDHIERSLNIDANIIEDSVRGCKLDRFRAIYYLTLKNMKQLTPYRKKKSSLMKLQPICLTPPLTRSKDVLDQNDLIALKTRGMKTTQLTRAKATIFDNVRFRNRDLPDSPRRLLDCLAAYNHI